MDIPRFDAPNVNPRLALAGIGDAFQEFVHQLLLPEFPQLHRFPSGGKDGAIDLIDTSARRLAVECKFVGEDDYAVVQSRWLGVKSLLDKHLREPGGPTLGQSQYGPWYSTDNPISEYWFCTSAIVANEQQRRTLQKSIVDFFADLASKHPHLAHLQKLKVEIVDWSDLTTRLQKQPHLIFRWFPSARPSGLVPLDEVVDVGTFRAYLTNAKLPYYSLAEHLRSVPPPPGTTILDEETLLNHFDNEETTGLIISGKGGVGKSRLALELGWRGLRRGWTVMRVQSRLKEDALERFVERLSPDKTALFLVDYIETQTDFGELVESINVLNDSGVARLRYVAACRTAYYYRAIAGSERHLPIDLTPPAGSAVQAWFAGYRDKTIEKILTEAGLPSVEKYLRVCHNIPILAVFLAYLHTSGRSEDLAQLLNEAEFGQWISKRIQLTFYERSISRELAQLVPLFPMEDAVTGKLPISVYRPIFDSLATDGWVEKLHTNDLELTESWITAHDVLADQILLSFVRSRPDTAEHFLRELFTLAGDVHCLRSTLVSLERISDSAPLNTVRWRKLISEAIELNQASWREVRDLLIRTTMLSVPDRLSLLQRHGDIWNGAESDLGFQKSLGWLARWVVKQSPGVVTEQDKQGLTSWIAKAAPSAHRSNFVITWGLRLAPEIVRETALSWIVTKPTLLQTHYLMVAWLDSGLPVNEIRLSVQQWCERFSGSFHLSFLAEAWLKAGGEKEVVRDAINDWLREHRRDAEAQFVYKAWLDAGGEKEMMRTAIADWLVEHGRDLEARFVYEAWLDAGGEKDLVQEALKNWLAQHRRELVAEFIFDSWLHAGGEKEILLEAIRDWLLEHGLNVQAAFVYKAWLDAGGERGEVEKGIKEWLIHHEGDLEARFVYIAWLAAGGDKQILQQSVKEWLVHHRRDSEAQFFYKAWLDVGGEKEIVQEPIKDWLVEHRTDAEAQFVYNAWLARDGDKQMVQAAIKDWLAEHQTDLEAGFVYNFWLDAGGEKDLVRDAIKEWLVPHGRDTEAQFVYKAWLDAGGGSELVREAITDWLVEHRRDLEAGFVYDSWLDAGGEKEVVQEAIRDWLVDHQNSAEASHVFKTWLDSGGEKGLVRAAIKEWLLTHHEDFDADHVFRSWLESGGERELVWDAALAWLSKYREEESAVYITKFIAKQQNLSANTIKDILAWCRKFSDNEDALWRLTQLGENLFVEGIGQDLVSTAEAVLTHVITATDKPDTRTRELITQLLSRLIAAEDLHWNPFAETINLLFLSWLRHPLSFSREPKPFWRVQRAAFLERLGALIDSGALNVIVEREALGRFLQWVDEWAPEAKQRVRPILADLKTRYPTDIWDTVRFDEGEILSQ